MNSSWDANMWEERDRCITSLDFVKQATCRQPARHPVGPGDRRRSPQDERLQLSGEIIAQQLRSRPSKVDNTKRYLVGEILSRHTEHMLFLTATPHRGDEEGFRLFLDLLRPGFFAQTELLKESMENKDNPVFVRRLKEDMRTFDGPPIFPPRHVNTVPFRLTPTKWLSTTASPATCRSTTTRPRRIAVSPSP